MKKLIFLTLFISSCLVLQAQDKIHLKSGKVIEGKVTEVGVDEIKYKVDKALDAAVFTVKRIDVAKIEFESGHVEKFMEEIDDPESYVDQNKRMIKMEFLSPLFGYTGLGYEQSIRPGMSWEVGLGLIGLGLDNNNDMQRGANIKAGIRFLKTPDFKSGNVRYWHVLKGAYVKPEITLGVFERNVTVYNYQNTWPPVAPNSTVYRQTQTYGAVNLVLGKQMVFANVFAVDIYAGIGYGFIKASDIPSPNYNEYMTLGGSYYGLMMAGRDFPFSGTAGLKFGYLFK